MTGICQLSLAIFSVWVYLAVATAIPTTTVTFKPRLVVVETTTIDVTKLDCPPEKGAIPPNEKGECGRGEGKRGPCCYRCFMCKPGMRKTVPGE